MNPVHELQCLQRKVQVHAMLGLLESLPNSKEKLSTASGCLIFAVLA